MRNLICIALCTALALLLPGLGLAQTTMSSTTLSAAVAVGDQEVVVASATGITAYTNTVNTMLFVDREAMAVTSVSGTRIGVYRSQSGSRLTAHASGATVWLGPPAAFYSAAPFGPCTATAVGYHPRVVTSTGELWSCPNSQWQRLEAAAAVGTPNTGVTAYEVGDGRKRVTKLSFTDLAIGTTVAAANEAYGKLLYTFPAGVVAVKAATMSVALTGSGTACDADTPDGGLGSTIATGAQALLSGVGATAEDILTGQTVANLTATATVKSVVNQPLAIEAAGAHTVHLNVADGWAAGACAITATGTVVLDWSLLN